MTMLYYRKSWLERYPAEVVRANPTCKWSRPICTKSIITDIREMCHQYLPALLIDTTGTLSQFNDYWCSYDDEHCNFHIAPDPADAGAYMAIANEQFKAIAGQLKRGS